MDCIQNCTELSQGPAHTINIIGFWDVMPRSSIHCYQQFRGMCSSSSSGQKSNSCALKSEVAGFSKMMVTIYRITWHHVPQKKKSSVTATRLKSHKKFLLQENNCHLLKEDPRCIKHVGYQVLCTYEKLIMSMERQIGYNQLMTAIL